MLKNMKLSTKILSVGIIITICFTLVLAWVYPKIKNNLYQAKRTQTEHVVEAAWGVLDYYAKQAKTNAMTEEEAKKYAKEAIKNMRYGEDEYFWINDLQAQMIMHPIKPEMDGQDQSDYKDTNGKRIFVEFAEVCRKDRAGFVDYVWPKPGHDKPVPKVSYVKLLPEWGWVIGTGIYIDDVEAELAQLTFAIFGVVIVIIAGSLIFTYYMTRSITRPMMAAVGMLNESADQVASASSQLSSSSQQLAEGSSEQAASLEETSATLEESSSMVRQNAENTKQASQLAAQAKTSADKGNAEMHEMMTSMSEIKKSSDQIARIIKVIDEIAFQTNILALNAAVEAARAGDAGMGFAVVAEEVRNLAQRSAQAAKDTQDIIEKNIALSEKGVDVAKRVGESLEEITTQARKVNELMDEIAASGQEQTQGILQINKAVGQMDKVTQQIAANAEESAAAAEELTAQAESMKEVVKELVKLIKGNSSYNSLGGRELSLRNRGLSQASNGIRKQRATAIEASHKGLKGALKAGHMTSRGSKKTHVVQPEEIIPLEDDTSDF